MPHEQDEDVGHLLSDLFDGLGLGDGRGQLTEFFHRQGDAVAHVVTVVAGEVVLVMEGGDATHHQRPCVVRITGHPTVHAQVHASSRTSALYRQEGHAPI